MMTNLEAWANGRRVEAEAAERPLCEASEPVDISSFMGRWYVIAAIPTLFDRGAMNSIEDCVYITPRTLCQPPNASRVMRGP